MALQRRNLKQTNSRPVGGAKLQELRNTAGLSLLDLAAKLESELGKHIDAAHINKIETGSIKKPQADTLKAILEGLHTSYRDRRAVLEAFGYQVPMTLPTEREVSEAVKLAAYELQDATYPVCLRDYGQRWWAWNRYAPRIIGLHPDDPATSRFVGITSIDLAFNPTFETLRLIANPAEFLPSMLQSIKVAIYPFREYGWYQELLANWRAFPGFSPLWDRVPVAPLQQVTPMRVNVPGDGVLQFHLSSTDFLHDPRIQILHFTPYGATTLRACAEWAEEEGVL